jgi:hypothetical protein
LLLHRLNDLRSTFLFIGGFFAMNLWLAVTAKTGNSFIYPKTDISVLASVVMDFKGWRFPA